jgi:putative nucleotidyltransferase with HDIG domain
MTVFRLEHSGRGLLALLLLLWEFWKADHAARQDQIGMALKDEGCLFVAGLLHDIGKVFLNLKFPEEFRSALALAHREGTLIAHAEEDVFQMNHAEVAARVTERWHLSDRLIEPIRYHHEPSLALKQSTETVVIHLSDILTRARGFGSGGDALVPLIDRSVWARLDLSTEEIMAILSESDAALREAGGFLSSL